MATGRAGLLVGARYRLREPVARGGSGCVWRAVEEATGSPAAVKEIVGREREDPSTAAARRAHALRGAELLGSLGRLPGIAALRDLVVDRQELWIVTDLVAGTPLSYRSGTEAMPIGAVASVGAGLAAVLSACHEKGFVHGDVKPGNVLMSPGHGAVLVDFDSAAPLSTGAVATGSAPLNPLTGTLTFAAPEVIRGSAQSAASDVFALGATLNYLLSGRTPYQAETVLDLIWEAHSAAPPYVPGTLGPLIGAMLDPDPLRRPSAPAVREAFGRWASPLSP